jgi:hypothetical protein
METIGWIICRLAAITYWLIGLAIKYLWYAVPGVFKVIWNPQHAPTALVLMLISALDVKLYDKLNLGTYHALWHGIIILSPFAYFYYLGKHKRNITVNKTITIKQQPTEPIPQPRPYRPQVEPAERRKDINPPAEFYEVRNAKTIDYIEID